MNFIIQVSNYGARKSVSMDLVLFELLKAHLLSDSLARSAVREFALDNWGCAGLSRIVQHEVLKLVCRASLVKNVFKTDVHSQDDIKF